jgi:hypothetical protein
MRSIRGMTITLAVAGTVAGCATGAANARGGADRAWANTVVTTQELDGIPQRGSLLDALTLLRPEWLLSRGGTPYVSVDGAPPTELSFLETILASTIREVQIERASSSVGRSAIGPNGRLIVGDIIVVTSRRGSGG